MRRLLERQGFAVLGFETAPYHHSAFNVLATLGLRKGLTASVSRTGLVVLGESMARRLGFWINLGDIMFAAALKR